MNEREKNRELIQQMAETLRNHAGPYREGAWEQFSAKYGAPKKRTIKWPYWAAAAVLLMVAGLVMFEGQREGDLGIVQRDAVRQAADPLVEATESISPTESGNAMALEKRKPNIPSDELVVVNELVVTKSVAHIEDSRDASASIALQPLLTENHTLKEQDSTGQQVGYLENALAVAVVGRDTLVPDADVLAAGNLVKSHDFISEGVKTTTGPEDNEPMNQVPEEGLFGQHLANDSYVNTVAEGRAEAKKWDLGLVISPSLTSEKINMGGGIAVAYRLSDRFSLGSGVSFGELGVAQNQQIGRMMDYAAAPTDITNGFLEGSASRNREVTSVTSNLLAIDIPLDLRYNLTERFYTSVGISFLTILNEQRTNHFVDRINQPTFGGNNSKDQDLESSIRAVYSSERIAQQPLEGRGYTGFVNFSVGRTMPLSKKLFLSVEPYFKLPVGRLSREDMDFTNGGIRIVTGF